MRPGFPVAIFCAALALGGSAVAGSVPPPGDRSAHLRYEAYWGGLHAADFTLSLRHRDGRFDHAFSLRTRGLMDWIMRLKVDSTSGGPATIENPLAPELFRSNFTSRRRDRTVVIRFDGPGVPAEAVHEVRDDDPAADWEKEARPVPPELRIGVLDPLAGLAEALRRVARHLAGDGPARFTLPGFDGRRRFDMDGEYLGRVRHEALHRVHDTHLLRLTTRPVAGFAGRHRLMWDGTSFDLYLSADGRLVPVQIVSVGIGPVINLVEECAGPCPLPAAGK